MAISDDEAYKQGKRIAEAMQKGTYSPSDDYSDSGGSKPAGVSGEGRNKAAEKATKTCLALLLGVAGGSLVGYMVAIMIGSKEGVVMNPLPLYATIAGWIAGLSVCALIVWAVSKMRYEQG